MKTDDLIRALAADTATRAPSVERWFAIVVVPGLVVSAALFALLLGPRADIAIAMGTFGFWFKYVATLSLALAATWLALRLVRPGVGGGLAALSLLIAPILVGLVAFGELSAVDPAMRAAKVTGASWASCLTYIPLLSVPILAAALIALRHGAPSNPALTGAVGGLLAGGFGAAIYAAYCPEDSSLFLATWYTLAIAIVTVAGAVLGARFLRW